MKTQILNYLLEVNEKGINGEINPLQTYIDLKAIENTLKDVMKGLYESAIDEAENYGKGEHTAFGAKFIVKNGPTRYDWSNVSDHVALKDQLKTIEKERKHLVGQGEVYNADGELLEVPEVKPGGTILSIKL
jgi:hypothetical protein